MVNLFFKDAQSIKIPGGISHGTNKPKDFKQVFKLKGHKGQACEQMGRVEAQTGGLVPCLKQAYPPSFPAATGEWEPSVSRSDFFKRSRKSGLL